MLERLADSKVGILVKGINGIQPDEIAAELSSQRKTHIYMAAVGYGISTDVEKSEYTLTPSIEKAVLWRSVPEYAGNIVVFVKTDTDKLHSLAEFDVISLRDVSKYLLELQISNESNAPTQNFWRALQQTSDYYSFEAIMEFVQSISNEETVAEAIPNNMWRLNLLCDADILGTKYKPSDRLTRNRELIFAIGQLSEDSRKKLSRSLAKTEGDDRIRLQNAYNLLQNLYKYGKRDMQLILSSSKLEDFIHFEGLPHLYSGRIISDATEATKVIKEVIFEESERRGRLLAEARVANIVEYNKKVAEKLAPIVVVIDEFADLADQLETTKEKNAFYKPVQRIAQAGRSRGIHLVICTQRPEAKLVPSTTKAQLNGRVALRVNDGISSRMIIEEPDAQYLQKHGDMIYRNGDIIERAQGYLIEIEELDKIVDDVIHGRI